MANFGGPKRPSDPGLAGGKVLPFVPARPAPAAIPAASPRTAIPPHAPPHVPPEQPSRLEPAARRGLDVGHGAPPEAPRPADGGEVARGAGVRARLAAFGVKGAEALPIKTAASDAPRLLETPLGRVFEGSLVVESARGLLKLEGVVRVTGHLVLQESAAKSPDLLALSSLLEVGGRLTIEGNHALTLLDGLQSLERARGIYLGFNPALQRASFPKLKEVEAALIVEGNAALTELSLPAFERGRLYLHVHDNAALATLALPSLRSVEGELSLLDNPRLAQVRVASKDRPAEVGAVELRGNALAAYPALQVRTR